MGGGETALASRTQGTQGVPLLLTPLPPQALQGPELIWVDSELVIAFLGPLCFVTFGNGFLPFCTIGDVLRVSLVDDA